jgi:hypothetical protein
MMGKGNTEADEPGRGPGTIGLFFPDAHSAARDRSQSKPQRRGGRREKHFGRGFSRMYTDGMGRTFAAPKGDARRKAAG